MLNFFDKSKEATASELKVNVNTGISESEVETLLLKYGENRLSEKKSKTVLQLFFEQFKDFLLLILVIAALVSIALSHVLDGLIILAVVILNAVIGVVQENKAGNALKALKEMSAPMAKVLRDGNLIKINSNMLVPGDVVVLEAGDYVPADVRLIESANLKIDESALTGESVPVEKDAEQLLAPATPLADRINCGYMGTVVTYGRGKAIVTATGMNTQMGNIASMLNETEEETTHLQKKLNQLGKSLGIICIIICVVIFGLGMWRNMPFLDVFMTSVSLAVAAIPEGLTVVVTVILALGMHAMVKSNAIVKKLSAVETLGSTTVICSDKTGTLTQNKMTVVNLYDTDEVYRVSGTGYSSTGAIIKDNEECDRAKFNKNIERLLEGAVLCSDASYNPQSEQVIGDPTEAALVVLGYKVGFLKDILNAKYPRVGEIPFDSDRKLMSTFHKRNEVITMYTKGAPDQVLNRCTFIYKNGFITPMTQEDREGIVQANEDFAKKALRVLALAFKEAESTGEQEDELVFIGLLAMIDPPREEAKKAIAICKKAGISVKMITGDHLVTATAIGRELGILGDADEGMDGNEIDSLNDDQLTEKMRVTNVYARVSPEHKVRLVKALKSSGEVAAMTGDGVNDAPSLKISDIGVAMGITGTEVSKEAADMILTDDNFASIVKAVEQGRTIYNNIRKVVGYLLSCNIGEILVIFVSMLAGLPMPLVPIQLLSVNLITDAFPAFALGMEAKEPNVMDLPPRDPKEPVVNRRMQLSVSIQSLALAAGTLGSFIYAYYNYKQADLATTACFITLVLGELLRAYSARSEYISLFKMKPFENSFLNSSVFLSVVFLFVVVYTPFLNPIFHTLPLDLTQLGIAVLFALVPMLGGELAKMLK